MITCRWCGRSFTPRANGGKPQHFCRPACRRALDAAGRSWIGAALADGRLTIDALRGAPAATPAFSHAHGTARPVCDCNEPAAPSRVTERFLVEVPAERLGLLLQHRWLRPHERDDVLAILSVLKRIGFAATVTRLS
jgi:hypothetical protein